MNNIRNFAIIAHIDHGKSTLADRLIEHCGAIDPRKMQDQLLDSMKIEKERGITIKSQTVMLNYKAENGDQYVLNLMDTPGHVDFSYEVSRSLAACEGSLLVVDATQGVEAQTLANVYKAIDSDHEIIPVINKVDLDSADPEGVKKQIEDTIGIDATNSVEVSAKTGVGIKKLLQSIVKYIPSPKTPIETSLQALLVDSWYDIYLGVVSSYFADVSFCNTSWKTIQNKILILRVQSKDFITNSGANNTIIYKISPLHIFFNILI